MGCYVLEAVGDHAKERDGGPDLLLWTDKPILLGRAVKEGEGYKYPNHWNSLSSKHCTLRFENGHFIVTDMSTNGTFINSAKIGKGNTQQLNVGDTFGLSLVPPAAVPVNQPFVNTVEYKLVYAEQTPSPIKAGSAAAATAKRKHSSSPATVAKRIRAESQDAADMLALKAKNDELRELNEKYRANLDGLEQQLRAAEVSKQETAAQHAQQLKDLEAQVRAEAADSLKAAHDSLAAEKARTTELTAQMAEQQAAAAGKEAQLKQDLQDLQGELDDNKHQVTQFTTQLQEQHKHLSQAQTTITQLQTDLKQQQEQSAAANASATAKQQQVRELASEVQALQQQLHDAQQQLAVVEEQMQMEKASRLAAETREKDALMQIRNAQRAAAAAKEQFDSKKEEVMLCHAQLGQMGQQLLEHRAEYQRQSDAMQATLNAFVTRFEAQLEGQAQAYSSLTDTMVGQFERMCNGSKPAAGAAAATTGEMNGLQDADQGEQQQLQQQGQEDGDAMDVDEEQQQQQQDGQQHFGADGIAGTQSVEEGHEQQLLTAAAPAAGNDVTMTQPAASGSPTHSRQTVTAAPLAAAAAACEADGQIDSAANMPPPANIVLETPTNSQIHASGGQQEQQEEQEETPNHAAGQEQTQDLGALRAAAAAGAQLAAATVAAAAALAGDDAGMTLQLLLPSGAVTGTDQQEGGVEGLLPDDADTPVGGLRAHLSHSMRRRMAQQGSAAMDGVIADGIGVDGGGVNAEAAAGDDGDGGDDDAEEFSSGDLVDDDDVQEQQQQMPDGAVAPPASLRVGGQRSGDNMDMLMASEAPGEAAAAAVDATAGAAVAGGHTADDKAHEVADSDQQHEHQHPQQHEQQQQQDDDLDEDVTDNPDADDSELGLTPAEPQQQQQQKALTDLAPNKHVHQDLTSSKQLFGMYAGSPQNPRSQPALGDILNQHGYARGSAGAPYGEDL